MAQTKAQRQAAGLKRALKESGRTVTWLAKEMGYTRPYVSNVLNGVDPLTEEFQERAVRALGVTAKVPVTFRGRIVRIPEPIYRRASELPALVVEDSYERAWKEAWIREHAEHAVIEAAERAWQAAQAIENLPALAS